MWASERFRAANLVCFPPFQLSKIYVLMQKKILKVVVTGPESTGKTAMANALAENLETLWSPEFARYYLAHLGRPYERNDLKNIGLGQKKWEEWYAHQIIESPNPQILISDTDWTVLHIWELYRYENETPHSSLLSSHFLMEWQKGYGEPSNADLYLLCAPDFPWQPDPLREHPEERDTLFSMYENLLRERAANFITLSGEHESRQQNALAAIRELF
jgi:nicotinamide riboside kinase